MNRIRPSSIYRESLIAILMSLILCGAAFEVSFAASVVTVPSDTVVVPAKYKRTEVGPSRIVLIGPEEGKAAVPNDGLRTDDSLPAQVFRVQLFTSKLYGEATRMSRIGRELCVAPVTLDYDVPYYKVRSGVFITRSEAEAYVSRAKSLGFTEAWIVFAANPLHNSTPGDAGFDETTSEEEGER